MELTLNLLRSLAFSLMFAGIAFLLRMRRQRKTQALLVDGYLDAEQQRLANYRADGGRIPDVRELNEDEDRLLTFLLCRARIVPGPLCGQLARARVVARCGCGCPSVDFEVRDLTPRDDKLLSIYENSWNDEHGTRQGLIVIARGGVLFGLQVYAMDGGRKPQQLPPTPELF
ncbi:MAG: hypothetical protein ACTHQM_02195 [Thermoanaerobaculia bacterium]